MCGIIGIVSRSKPVAERLTQGLRHLEYRGYDSVGIVTVNGHGLDLRKNTGRVDDVNKSEDLEGAPGSIGIAHCRWGTHGGITQANAHPHLGPGKRVAIVHNGIIDNQLQLRNELIQNGSVFASETDSEVIAHLIENAWTSERTLGEAVQEACRQLKGSWALAVIAADQPGTMVITRHESPLVIGFADGEHLIASDVTALLPWSRQIARLENHQTVVLESESCRVFDEDGREGNLHREIIDWDAEEADKKGWPHYMLKEIHEQPNRLAATVAAHLNEDTADLELDLGLGMDIDALANIDQVRFLACGTSWHSGMVGEFLFEELARTQSFTHIASEFRYRQTPLEENTLIVGISQSGETADTNAALEEAKRRGAKTLAICNVQGSTMTRICDATLYTHAGPEIGVASTKAFTTQLMVLHLLTLAFCKAKKTLDAGQIRRHVDALRQVPLQVEAILNQNDLIRDIAKQFTARSHALFMGRGVHYPIALEGALKLKEISYIHAEGYPAAEMKHGPIALIDPNMPSIFICPEDKITYQKTLGNIQEVKARQGVVLAVATEGDSTMPTICDHVVFIPPSHYSTSALLSVVPLQLLSYHVAELRGCDVDKPRNLSKVVTVE